MSMPVSTNRKDADLNYNGYFILNSTATPLVVSGERGILYAKTALKPNQTAMYNYKDLGCFWFGIFASVGTELPGKNDDCNEFVPLDTPLASIVWDEAMKIRKNGGFSENDLDGPVGELFELIKKEEEDELKELEKLEKRMENASTSEDNKLTESSKKTKSSKKTESSKKNLTAFAKATQRTLKINHVLKKNPKYVHLVSDHWMPKCNGYTEVTGGLFPDRYGEVKELEINEISEEKYFEIFGKGDVSCKYMDKM